MRYLLEHQVGFDKVRLGFPSVMGCAAIVISTDGGLYGYHMPPVSSNYENRIKELANFINGHLTKEGSHNRLYLTTFCKKRYNDKSCHVEAQEEAKKIAKLIGYKGHLRVADMSNNPSLHGSNSAYVEYINDGPKCRIYAKPWTDAMSRESEKTTQTNIDFGRIVSKSCGIVLDGGVGTTITKDVDSSQAVRLHTIASMRII